MSFKDHFSGNSANYAKFRPNYPAELYEIIFNELSSFASAWDVGCGNGQVALALANQFEKVYASDANFLLVKVDNANKRYQQLVEKGIVVRNRTNQVLCENCLRLRLELKVRIGN